MHQDLQSGCVRITGDTQVVMDMQQLHAAIFERDGIAIDEHDPIMAAIAA